jgi:hypothetical protein
MRSLVAKRLAALATILTAVPGCDKARGLIDAGRGAAPDVSPADALNLATRPDILFKVFGDREDPRMIPVAAIENGHLKRILLPPDGWRQFDAMYLRSGKSYPLYQDGRARGTVRVAQGMWERPDAPLYTLPGCTALTPLAGVRVEGVKASFTLELLASTLAPSAARSGSARSVRDPAAIARQVAQSEAGKAGIDSRVLAGLDFRAVTITSGATDAPTVIGAFLDPSAADATSPNAQTVHLFVIADRDAGDSYTATFTHAVNGPISGAEYRRYYGHLDLTADGVDEIVLEGWRVGEESFLLVLGFINGRWQEVFRGRGNWCLDD